MQHLRRVLAIAIPAVLLFAALRAFALAPGPDGFYHTGDSVRVKTIAFIDIKVYTISHEMKTLPATKSKRAVIDIDTDKRITFQMLRGVAPGKIKKMFREGFADNGYTDAAAIESFVGVFKTDLKNGTKTTIFYDSQKKAVTITTEAGGTATIPGVAFMRATWSLWFGKIDQPSLGDDLISKL